MRLPVFPLSVVLFPGTPMPLHIFEPRYRQMLDDCLAGDRRFGITPPGRAGEAPDPGMVGCIGRSARQPGAARRPLEHRGPRRRPVRGGGAARRVRCRTTSATVRDRSRTTPAPCPSAEPTPQPARGRSLRYAALVRELSDVLPRGPELPEDPRRPLVPRRGRARHRPGDQAAAAGGALDRPPGGGAAARAAAAHRGRRSRRWRCTGAPTPTGTATRFRACRPA